MYAKWALGVTATRFAPVHGAGACTLPATSCPLDWIFSGTTPVAPTAT